MAKRSGMYKSEKRKKELLRKKKQEEKRLRRYKNVKEPSQHSEIMDLQDDRQITTEGMTEEAVKEGKEN